MLASIFTAPARSQSSAADSSTDWWFGVGLGASAAGPGPETVAGGGLAGLLSASVRLESLLLEARCTANTGGDSGYGAFFGGTMHDEFFDAGLLAGYDLAFGERWHASFAAGLSWVWGSRVRSNPGGFFSKGTLVPFRSTLGVPLEIGVGGKLGSIFGAAVVAHANINREEPFVGITADLLVGNFQ